MFFCALTKVDLHCKLYVGDIMLDEKTRKEIQNYIDVDKKFEYCITKMTECKKSGAEHEILENEILVMLDDCPRLLSIMDNAQNVTLGMVALDRGFYRVVNRALDDKVGVLLRDKDKFNLGMYVAMTTPNRNLSKKTLCHLIDKALSNHIAREQVNSYGENMGKIAFDNEIYKDYFIDSIGRLAKSKSKKSKNKDSNIAVK